MTQHNNSIGLHPAVESILRQGFEGMADSIRLLINEAMKIERSESLQAHPYERTEERKGHSNGFKNKTVQTRVGAIDLDVPQVRGNCDFYPKAIEKGLRTERSLNLAICEMYIQGVSTRKVELILKELVGVEVSHDRVSRVAKELDDELEVWRKRKLDWVRYLIIDARYEKVRVDGLVRDCALLVAYGVQGDDGKRSVLGVSVSLSEAETHWRDFLRSLKERGLRGLEMITSDAHSGLKAALMTEFQGVPWQRCQFHLQQNAGHYVPKLEMKKAAAADIRAIFRAPDLEEAERLLQITIKKYEKVSGKVSDWMRDNLHEGLTVFSLPQEHRVRLRTSNLAEVTNRELKRRTRVIGIFPNESSLLRICSAHLKALDERWIENRAYLNMSLNPGQ
jgi:transposase-like protein